MNDKAVIQHEDQPQAVQVFNPLDADPAQFGRQLVQRQENYDSLALHLRGMLVPGHDFGQIHVANKAKCPKPWECSPDHNPGHWSKHQLFAAGADKVLGILGLAVNYPNEQDLMRAAMTGKELAEIIIKCEIVGHSGQVIAEEFGACGRDEFPANTRCVLNNCIKRAAKRARVGAVLRLPSISALFEPEHLATIQTSAGDKGNGTAARAQQPQGRHATGAELEAMPFGKHKGEQFQDLDDSYIEWLLLNMQDKPDILAAARKESERRGSAQAGPVSRPAGSEAGSEDHSLPPVDSYEDDFNDAIPF